MDQSKLRVAIATTIVLLTANIAQAQFDVPTGQLSQSVSKKAAPDEVLLLVHSCNDFNVTGKGDNSEWYKTEWNQLAKIDKDGKAYESKFKILYSAKGIYVLFNSQDDKITTKAYKDFENIFNGDVVEVFFHPNPPLPVYFEYELNQLDKELILTLSNIDGQSPVSWIPWYRSGIKKMVEVVGGKKALNGTIQSWSAEIFFPYGALGLLPNVPPKKGSLWNANFCRLDYDSGNMVKYSWTPTIEKSFHELEKFQTLKFE